MSSSCDTVIAASFLELTLLTSDVTSTSIMSSDVASTSIMSLFVTFASFVRVASLIETLTSTFDGRLLVDPGPLMSLANFMFSAAYMILAMAPVSLVRHFCRSMHTFE